MACETLVSAPPTVSISFSPAAPLAGAPWYVGPVGVTVGAVDDQPGALQTRCVLDPPARPTDFAALPPSCAYLGAGATVAADGRHVLYAASADATGAAGALRSKELYIDGTLPATAATAAPLATAAGWHTADITLNLTAADAARRRRAGITYGATGAQPIPQQDGARRQHDRAADRRGGHVRDVQRCGLAGNQSAAKTARDADRPDPPDDGRDRGSPATAAGWRNTDVSSP